MSDLIRREDAIEALHESGLCYDNWLEVRNEINALPSAEAVSREAIISAKFHPYPFTKITPMDVGMESYKRGWNDALDAVADNAPSAEAVQGEWIEKGGELVCSVCGNSVSFSRTPKGWVLGKFCQSCGAKMNKGGE